MAKEKYVAFLRGINVGGHHKVPMETLRETLKGLEFESVQTLLNSGNILFESAPRDITHLETTISERLQIVFGFPVPTMVLTAASISTLIDTNPFKNIPLTKDTRLYISFLQKDLDIDLKLPWTSDDYSYTILTYSDKTIVSVLDLSISKTPKAMKALEHYFGKDTTTRNWNTINRIEKKLNAN